jgi:Zn-dependent oligopeptidase
MKELTKIKEEAMKDLSKKINYIGTHDALYAHLIMVIVEATQTSFTDNNQIKIVQPFNDRSCFPLSALDYFGSFTFWSYS